MLALYIALGVLGLVFIVLLVIGLGQPTNASVSKEITVSQPVSNVFDQCVLLRNFVKWSPWSEKDPKMILSFSDEDGEIDSWYKWKGNRTVGIGSMTIKEIVPNERIVIELIFGYRNSSLATFSFREMDAKTVVTWSFESEIGKNPLQRAMIPMMNKYVGRDFEKGLLNLKKQCDE